MPACKLVGGKAASCGCGKFDIGAHTTTHGATVGRRIPPEYQTWQGAIDRCENPNSPSYPNYGGRGIRMCPEWRYDFAAFLAYMGPRPPGRSIDRLDPNRGYEPGNCRWATDLEQGSTKRCNIFVDDNGERIILKELARRRGIDYNRLFRAAVTKGIPLSEAVEYVKNTIPRSGKNHTHCKRGHELTPENTRYENNGRQCRTCDRLRVNARKRGEHVSRRQSP